MRKTLFSLLAGCSLMGCYYDVEEELYPGACNTLDVTYSGTVAPIMAFSCAVAGCHVPGGTGPGDLGTYPGVKAAADNGTLRAAVIDLKVMPPSGPLSPCQQQQIDQWLQAGAPNN
ncbi:MAG: hypothetical protein KDB88_11815 [Flavobacteriales bacterium]|nr:hypothetical protein [Flavobacteriales bacterium]